VQSVKAEDLRTLDGEELTTRLKGARRELYELRFKLAVGQLDDHRQIRKVRKDIARILTVVHARRLGEEILEVTMDDADGAVATATAPAPAAAPAAGEAEEPVAEAAAETPDEETPENVETAKEAPAPRPRARRRTAGEEGND
jgi:large subunit ribosomal protein L29